MPVDSINYGCELRNIFAEIKPLKAEVANMQSALLGVQEQSSYAIVELLNHSNELDKEISEIKSQLQNYYDNYNDLFVELANLVRRSSDETKNEIEKFKSDSQQKFNDFKIKSEKISDLMNGN